MTNYKLGTIESNGYTIKMLYAGGNVFIAEKDGDEVYFGYSVDGLIDAIGFNPYENKEDGNVNIG